jgi:hypothetical protein
MPDPIAALEDRREAIARELAQIGDMRRGSITETYRRCGKAACACQASGHPGHGPYYAFTTKVGGKTRSVQLRAGARLNRFQREVDAYRRFRALTDALFEVNEAICDARPEEPDDVAERAKLKKTLSKSSRKRSRTK